MTYITIPCPRCPWTGSTKNELATHHLDTHERPLPEAAKEWCAVERWRHRNGTQGEEAQHDNLP